MNFVTTNGLPTYSYVELFNDHPGTYQDIPTNDAVTKQISDFIMNNSAYKDNTVIVITEDDTQNGNNGPDHVSNTYRVPLVVVASPKYMKQHYITHVAYTTNNVLAAMETGGGCSGLGTVTSCTDTGLVNGQAYPGFETGSVAPWSATSGVINNSSSEPPHSGSWDAWLDGYGTTHTDTLSQSITLPTGCSNYNLSFWLHIDTAETTTTTAYDKLTVRVLNSSGTVLSTLHMYSNLDHNTGYAQRSFSLSAYAGQKITLKFTGPEYYTKQTSFVIDDTAINLG